MSPEFLSLEPEQQDPGHHRSDGPGGEPLPLFESGAILIYLADEVGQVCCPPITARRCQAHRSGLMFQVGGVGPCSASSASSTNSRGKDYEDKRPRDRYVAESHRLLGVLDGTWRRALDDGRRVHHRRHRDLSVVQQARWLLSAGDLVGFGGVRDT